MYLTEKKTIRIYHTHIEIFPYEKGENEKIERMLSIWVDAEFHYDTMGYFINDRILYEPREDLVYQYLKKNSEVRHS